ncbi:hypothetical protein HMPREF6485_0181 [Segatella buccae ATCC 33574]|uniref:Uncharacterized protein n=1 Tax=Segatella buccae ATCC 33574 TaxID=873513 RepID=E6K3M8_9BACT|nr:hypothetical protein HMPREF6485_0181 [Segatella buccae ATCC 33574]
MKEKQYLCDYQKAKPLAGDAFCRMPSARPARLAQTTEFPDTGHILK